MSSRNPHEPSCTECRTRKAKCSKERPCCSSCAAAGRECTYVPRTARTPLTRAYLARVENRLNRFEAAFKSLFPSGDVDQLVNTLIQGQSSQVPEMLESTSMENELGILPRPTDHGGERLASLNEVDPGNTGLCPPNLMMGGLEMPLMSVEEGDAEVSSFMPPAELKPPRAEEVYLVDSYFSTYHLSHPFVDEDAFRRVHQSNLPGSQTIAWQVLCKALMAMGAWCQCDSACEVDISLYLQAERTLRQLPITDPGDLTLIQALLLLSDFAQKRGLPEAGMQYLGIAVQKAVALGLHREQPQPTADMLEQEMKRRVWWSLYVFDSCAAKSYGRPLMLPDDNFMNVKPPLNIAPEDLRLQDNHVPVETDGPTIYSGLIAQATFHSMANRIYRHLVINSPVSLEQVIQLERQVDEWQTRYPPYVRQRPSADDPVWLKLVKDRLAICDKNLRLLILRPFLMRWATLQEAQAGFHPARVDVDAECAVRCVTTASDIMAMVLERLEQPGYPRLGVSFLLYCLFHGILIHVCFLKSGSALPDGLQFSKDLSRTRNVMSDSWLRGDPQSAHWLNVIQNLCVPLDA